jgi:hypothetical protein
MSVCKRAATLVAAVAVLLFGATGAMAITNGQPDGTNHPYVGLMVALDKDGVPQWRCSGSLLTPTVFLTAGHCTEPPAAHVEVWFSPGPVVTDPDYAAALAADPDGIVSCNDSPMFDGYPCRVTSAACRIRIRTSARAAGTGCRTSRIETSAS